MNNTGALILKLFIHHYHPDAPDMLLKHLPKDQAHAMQKIKLHSQDLKPLLTHRQNLFSRLHPTWIEQIIKKTALPLDAIKVRSALQPFVINELFVHLEELPELPLEYIAPTDLTFLSQLNSDALEKLSFYLGLYDLAAELRHIVDKVSIQNLYSCLSEQELIFLKGCLQKKERITVPKLGIDPHKKEPAKWRVLLLQRGIIRLSKALAGENRDLVWYISRSMIYDEGNKLYQQHTEKPIPEVTAILKSQINAIMNYLKKIGAV